MDEQLFKRGSWCFLAFFVWVGGAMFFQRDVAEHDAWLPVLLVATTCQLVGIGHFAWVAWRTRERMYMAATASALLFTVIWHVLLLKGHR
jgi:hypothetical protein